MKQLIGKTIQEERKRQGLSQQALADKVGASRYQVIAEIEKGNTNYGIDVLIKVTEALGICFDLRTQNNIIKPMFQFSKIEPATE